MDQTHEASTYEPAHDGGLIEHVSLPDAVHTVLRRRILNNDFVAGERLVESKLAEEFGVSRTTLRSALRDLATENLVEVTKRRGCFVARMSESDVKDSCFARFVLESGAACEDLSWITPETIGQLELEIEKMKVAALGGDMASIVDADTSFHGVIVAATGRPRVSELWHVLDGQMGSLIRSSMDQRGIDWGEIVDRHREVIDALRTGERELIQEALKHHYLEELTRHDDEADNA